MLISSEPTVLALLNPEVMGRLFTYLINNFENFIYPTIAYWVRVQSLYSSWVTKAHVSMCTHTQSLWLKDKKGLYMKYKIYAVLLSHLISKINNLSINISLQIYPSSISKNICIALKIILIILNRYICGNPFWNVLLYTQNFNVFKVNYFIEELDHKESHPWSVVTMRRSSSISLYLSLFLYKIGLYQHLYN